MPANSPETIPVISMGIANHITQPWDDDRVKRVWPGPEIELSAAEVAEAYPWPLNRGLPWVRANMVISLDGSIVGTDGVSKSISSPADRSLFGQLRRAAEVILVGASTVRAENYRPAPIPLAVVSNTLNLPADLALFAEASEETARSMVLSSQVAIDAAPSDLAGRIDLIDCGTHKFNPRTAIDALAARGLTRSHCEGGPTLLTALIEANCLDELLLTVSPVFVGSAARLLSPSQFPGLPLQPKQVLTSDGSVFLRYLVTSE